MIGTWRVRSLPRISSASSKPSMSGICTSSRASATSCSSSSSSASAPERASSSSTSSRRSSAESASRFSSRSSTSRHFTRAARGRSVHDRAIVYRAASRSAICSSGSTRSTGLRFERRLGHRAAPARSPVLHDRDARRRDARPRARAAPSSLAPVRMMPSRRCAVDVRGRLEQHVDRRPGEVHRLVDRQRQPRPVARPADGSRAARSRPCPARPAPCPRLRGPAARTCGAKISTSRLGRSRGRCRTTNTGARSVAGSAGSRTDSASTPPADVPITMASIERVERRRQPSRVVPLLEDPILAHQLDEGVGVRRRTAATPSSRCRETPGGRAPRGTARPRGPAARD